MKEECRNAVAKAAGRTLTQAEEKDIEDRVTRAMKANAVIDRAGWLGMSKQERMEKAAQTAAAELDAERAKKKQRTALTIRAHDEIENYLQQQKSRYGWGPLKSLGRVLANFSDLKSDRDSIEGKARAVYSDFMKDLVHTYEAAGPKIFGLFANREGQRALMWELMGKDSRGIVSPETAALAKEGAEKWTQAADLARQRFNAGGAKIGALEDWALPQKWIQSKTVRTPMAEFVQDFMSRVDRQRYVNADGSLMNDADLKSLIETAKQSIDTGGANKSQPGRWTNSMMANRFSEQRVLHIADPDAAMFLRDKYGTDMWSTMVGHMKGMAKNIATIETLGPNPSSSMKYWTERAYKEETLASPKSQIANKTKAIFLNHLYQEVSGTTDPVANSKVAQVGATARNWEIATKFGGALISSISHQVPFHLTAFGAGLPQWQLMKNFAKILTSPEAERLSSSHGHALDTMSGDMNLWADDHLGSAFSQKMARAVVRVSGLNALNEARNGAMGESAMSAMAHIVESNEKLSDVHHDDARYMTTHGATDKDWSVWKMATPEFTTFGKQLTPQSIYSIPDEKLADLGNPQRLKWDAVSRLLGISTGWADIAANAPSSVVRATTTGAFKAGTVGGELGKTFFLAKTYPLNMIRNQWMMGLNMPTTTGKAIYIASLVAGTTALAAFSIQLKQLLRGEDPEKMDNGKFWTSALLQGGSTGMYGNFLLDPERADLDAFAFGPVSQDMEKFYHMTKGNMTNYMTGKKTQLGSDVVSFAKSMTPGQNLWYTQAATNRLIFDQMQEMVNPGYATRQTNYAIKNGYDYWWKPGQPAPERAPDMNNATQ